MSPLLFNTTLVEVLSNIVFANDMIVYRKYHRTGTKKLLEAISGIQQGHEIQVSIKKSYFYVLAPNNWKVKVLKVQFTVPSKNIRASLVAQWLRICLPMQETRVRALVWEDPTCHGATRPMSHNC